MDFSINMGSAVSINPGGAVVGLVPTMVDSLDNVVDAKEGAVYLVRNGEEGDNVYDEYIYTDGHFELLGSSTARAKADIVQAISEKTIPDEDIRGLFK